MAREEMLGRIRAALGRKAGAPVPPPPAPYLPTRDVPDRVVPFFAAIERLAGKTRLAAGPVEACEHVAQILAGRRAIASNSSFLKECGITALPGVESGFAQGQDYRAACASAAVGITSADYGLAETGSLVMLSSGEEARMISLLPPLHIAVLPQERLLANLDELIRLLPQPAEVTSSMVFITGPSRTGDIEQILIRGVHGPAEIHVVVVASTK